MSRIALQDGGVLVHVLPAETTREEAYLGRMGFQVVDGVPDDAEPGWVLLDGAWQPPPGARRWIWGAEFVSRFTDDEYRAMKAVRASAPAVQRLWDALWDPQELKVELDSAPVVAGLEALAQAGVLSPERVAALRA